MAESFKQFDLSNRVFILAIILIAGILVCFLVGALAQFADLPQNAPQDIVVSGTGRVYVKPDIATISLGVKTEGLKSADVVNQNNEKMNGIITAIKDLGIEDKDIRTSSYNLYPVYNYTENRGREFQGYALDQQVTIKIRDFDKINSVLDKANEKGANTIGDLQFTVDDQEKAKTEARTEAINMAKEKATGMVQNSGLRIIKLLNISESSTNYPSSTYGMGGGDMLEKSISSAVPIQIQTGQQELSVTVYLTYRVK